MPDQHERWLPCAFLNAFKFMCLLSRTLCSVYHHSKTRDGAVNGIWAHVGRKLQNFDLPRSVFHRIQHFWPGITVAWRARHYATSSIERISIGMPLLPSSDTYRNLLKLAQKAFQGPVLDLSNPNKQGHLMHTQVKEHNVRCPILLSMSLEPRCFVHITRLKFVDILDPKF